ncbi:MAG TPA: glycerophosphodiester phosphodiesterase [Candidatus Limnocylindria bacterium]|nr:glycerophosphodiester phosphodiesterase [Candidatus Limnocylindria bacterium]
MFRIVAHRGVTAAAPENTMAAFARAALLGVDAVELDVRLTSDRRLAVYHYYYLDGFTTGAGPIFAHTAGDLESLRVVDRDRGVDHRIPMLEEVLDRFAGRLGLEIELKGPEPEAAASVAKLLSSVRSHWDRIEITSFEPALLTTVRAVCRDHDIALLLPPSEAWMRSDVVAHAALQRARLAQAQAVHLHPVQINEEVVATIRAGGVNVHAHGVNDERSRELAVALDLPWICTDEPESALDFRRRAGGARAS